MTEKKFTYSAKEDHLLIDVFLKSMNLSESLDIDKEVKNILEMSNFPDTIINLRDIQIINSTGIGVLINLRIFLKSHNRRLFIVCKGEHIISIFKLIKIDKILSVYPSVEEAVAALRAEPPAVQ